MALVSLAQSAAPYASLRVLIVRENWIGNTGLSVLNAVLRAGAWASGISETEYVPTAWKGLPMRTLRRFVRPYAVRQFNRALQEEAKGIHPHLFLAVKGTFVTAETLRAFRRQGITCFCFYPDVSFLAHGRYLPEALPEYDWIFTTKSFGEKDLRDKLGIRHSSFLPHAYDPEIHRPRPPTPELLSLFGADVSFVGAWSPKKQHYLEALVERRPKLNLKVWGPSWDRLPAISPLRRFTAFKPITGIGYATVISCSKINLGLLSEKVSGASSGDLITSRTFHIPACGGLLLHERTEDLTRIFKEDDSCVCFSNIDEMVAKVDALLSDDRRRQALAERGRKVVETGHSWDERVRTILNRYLQENRGSACV
jgi:glycosyltransferase involved in cell wall biosynthesis